MFEGGSENEIQKSRRLDGSVGTPHSRRYKAPVAQRNAKEGNRRTQKERMTPKKITT